MATEWHKIEFLSPGQRRQREVVKDGGDVQRVDTHEYHPQDSLGHGYYEVVDGVVTRHLDRDGNELDMDRIHECRVVSILKSSPFQSP